jgi:hypothetical protein
MCEEHRATFQKVHMDENGKVTTHYSVTLNRIQAWSAVIVTCLTIIASIVGGAAWVKAAVVDVAHDVFHEQLADYHAVMRPQLYEKVEGMIDQNVGEHREEASQKFEVRLDKIESRLDTLETMTETELSGVRRDIDRVEKKIDRLLER